MTRLANWLAAALALVPVVAVAQATPERIGHGNFERVSLYRPAGEVRQVVLLLSDAHGWDSAMDATARALAGDGALAIGIDVPALRSKFLRDGGGCVFPDGDLENLSHYVQGYLQLPTYRAPLLVGHGEGAALAYAMAGWAQPDVFAGAVTVGFRRDLDLGRPACKGVEPATARDGSRAAKGARGTKPQLLPQPALAVPWVALHGTRDTRLSIDALRAFTAGMRQAAIAPQPQLVTDDRAAGHWLPGLRAAVRELARRTARAAPPPPEAVAGLPLIEVPATARGREDVFAVLLSGDGGWAGLDKEVAAALAAEGIPVVGFDSLRYFWKARTPAGLATDVDRIVRTYAVRWKRPRVVLIGYSQGADVLPFAVNRLPAATRADVAQTVLIGLAKNASFEFHVGNWLSAGDDDALPILPEVSRLSAAQTVCIYGDGDGDETCSSLPKDRVRTVELPGGHHFDGDYAALAEAILSSVPPSPAR